MTPNPAPRQTLQPATAPDSADLFDYELLRDYLGFAVRSVRRH
jgi:hypothetical protein